MFAGINADIVFHSKNNFTVMRWRIMIKKFFVCLAIFILNISITYAAENSVVDTAKVFNANQIKILTEKIEQVEQKHQIRIGINFIKSVGQHNIDTVANERLRKYFSDGVNGGAILVVDINNRKWNVAIDAKLNQRIMTYSDIANDDFYNKLHANDFVGACNVYIENIDRLLNYYETNGEAYDSLNEFNPMALMIAILLAIIIGFGIRSWLIGTMSNVRHANEAIDYLKRDSIRITENRDTYLYTNVSRQQKSRSSSHGGGRNSGGGSSGGGSF